MRAEDNRMFDRSMPGEHLRVGYVFAILASLGMIGFDIFMLLGILAPWAVDGAIVASLLIAPSFVVLVASLHRSVQEGKKLWTQTGLSFAILYAAIAMLNYFLQLSVVRHASQEYAWLTMDFSPASAFWALEVLMYTLMGFAGIAVAPVFEGGTIESWIRWLLILNGITTTLGAIGYILSGNPLQVLVILSLGVWAIAFPVATILIAVLFKRRESWDKMTSPRMSG